MSFEEGRTRRTKQKKNVSERSFAWLRADLFSCSKSNLRWLVVIIHLYVVNLCVFVVREELLSSELMDKSVC